MRLGTRNRPMIPTSIRSGIAVSTLKPRPGHTTSGIAITRRVQDDF